MRTGRAARRHQPPITPAWRKTEKTRRKRAVEKQGSARGEKGWRERVINRRGTGQRRKASVVAQTKGAVRAICRTESGPYRLARTWTERLPFLSVDEQLVVRVVSQREKKRVLFAEQTRGQPGEKPKPRKAELTSSGESSGSARLSSGAKCENGVQATSRSRASGERQNKALAATR